MLKTNFITKTIKLGSYSADIRLDVEDETAVVTIHDTDFVELAEFTLLSKEASDLVELFNTVYHEIKNLEVLKENEKGN